MGFTQRPQRSNDPKKYRCERRFAALSARNFQGYKLEVRY
jgi:hypothetical protein